MSQSNRSTRSKISLRKKLLFSVLTTVGFFVLLEGVLAVAGVQPETDTSDRFVGFSSQIPLLELSKDDDGQEILSTAANKLHWFNYQSFPKAKPPGTLRIFCMGGSTTYGHPYWDSTSFAGWLRRYLPIVDPQHQWQVINAGGISYASYRVAALMEELAQYEPDLFVVYSAHNEFLERRTYANIFERSQLSLAASALLAKTRVWSFTDGLIGRLKNADATPARELLSGEVNEMLNHTIGPVDYHRDDNWRAKVVMHYESNLRRMAAIAHRAGAKILFVSPASNEKNCSPFKSEHREGLSVTEQSLFDDLMIQAQQAANQSDFAAAQKALQAANSIDDQYAELHYRVGQASLAQGNTQAAVTAFQRALNQDICPLRATADIQQAVLKVTAELQLPLVDFDARLRRFSTTQFGSSILGEEVFLDHVHPTIEGNRQLAIWMIEELLKHKIVQGKSLGEPEVIQQFEQQQQAALAEIDNQAEAFAMRNLAKVLHWAGKYEEAAPRARDTLEFVPNDPESRYILASCLANTGQVREALEEYALLFADGVGFYRAYQPYGELLAANGEFEQAKGYLMLAILRSPENATAFASLAEVHLRLGEREFAQEAIAESLRLAPNSPEALRVQQSLNSAK